MKNEFLIRKLERSLQDNPNNVQAHYELGRLYEEDGEFSHAIRELERAVNLSPSHVPSRFELGIVYSRLGRGGHEMEMAVREWAKMTDEDGDIAFDRVDYSRQHVIGAALAEWEKYRNSFEPTIFTFFNLGFAHMILNKLDQAARDFEKVLSINSRFETANYYLGLISERRGQYSQAAELFMRELEARPHSPHVYYALALVLLKLNDSNRAIMHLQKALQLKPRYIKATYRLGTAYAATGQFELAVTHLERAVEFMPTFYEAHFQLAQVYEKQFRMDQAIAEYHRALEINPRYKEARFQLGLMYKNIGKPEQALQQLNEAVDLDPLDAEAYYSIGLIRSQLGHYEEAAKNYERALQSLPNHAYAHYSLGIAYSKINRHQDAVAAFKRALELNPRDAQARNQLGAVLFQKGELEASVQEFEKVLESNPRDAQAHYYYGTALFKMNRLERAIEEFQKVASLNPDSPYAHFTLGASYSLSGDYTRAVQEYMKASSMTTGEGDLSLFATMQLLAAIGLDHAQKAHEMQEVYDRLEQVYIYTVRALTNAIDARDTYTKFHSSRVSSIARHFATHLHGLGWGRISEKKIKAIEMGGYMHDVGKIGVPDYVLRKEGKLTSEERMIIEMHPTIGADIIENLDLPWHIMPIVRHHHERWDGSGYPDNLSGEEIAAEAQIVSVADFWDALSTARPYKPAFTPERCIEELQKQSGKHFNPELVEIFVPFVDELILLI